MTAWVPGLESVDQYGAALGGSPQVWQAGTNNNNRGPRSAWRGARPVAGQRQTMWSASLIHLTLCALFAHNARVPHRPLNDCESAGGPEGGFVENVPAHSPQPNAEHGGGGAGGGYGARVETRTWGRDKKFLCQLVRAFSLSGGMRERERACEREAEGEKSLFKTDAVNEEDSLFCHSLLLPRCLFLSPGHNVLSLRLPLVVLLHERVSQDACHSDRRAHHSYITYRSLGIVEDRQARVHTYILSLFNSALSLIRPLPCSLCHSVQTDRGHWSAESKAGRNNHNHSLHCVAHSLVVLKSQSSSVHDI